MHAEALGALGGDVKAQHDVATTTEGASRPTAGDSESQGSLAEEPPVGIAATGKLWSPTFGTSSSANVRGSRPRRIRQTLTWTSRASLDGFRRRFFPDDAYEHDFKLVNPSKSRLAAELAHLQAILAVRPDGTAPPRPIIYSAGSSLELEAAPRGVAPIRLTIIC
ncbi:MAG: hypothetical protein M3296_02435 [Actinomycetota bacterium]|nr:hypothetical protein [Actinomycetota bacterium]